MRVLTAAVALLLALPACNSERRAISRDDLPDVPSEPDHVIVLDDDGFDTDGLEVTTDDLVLFKIEGTKDHGIRANDTIDTGILYPGESTYVVFDAEDTYEVVDIADDSHRMTVTASAAAS